MAVAEDMDYEHMLEREEVAHNRGYTEGNMVRCREVHEVPVHRNSWQELQLCYTELVYEL
jgi:hypothetical protein